MTTTAPPDPFRPGYVLRQFIKYASKSALPTLAKVVKRLDKAPEKPVLKEPLPRNYKLGDYPW